MSEEVPNIMDEIEGKVFIAMPSRGTIPVDIITSYLSLLKPKHSFFSTNIVPLDAARNSLVATFLVKYPDFSHILFWDDDMIPSRDALMKLWAHNEPIVSGLYFQTSPPFAPVWGLFVSRGNQRGFTPLIDWVRGHTYYVDGVGMGFCLIRRDVFQKIYWPPFEFTEFSEDYTFCLRAKQAGYKIKVDTSVIVKHMGTRVPVDLSLFEAYQPKLIEKSMEVDIV